MSTPTVERRSPRVRRSSPTALSGAARFRPGWVPFLWVGLPLAAVVVFYIYPFVNTLVLSLTDAKPLGGGGTFVGLENYGLILTDPAFHRAVVNNLVYAAVVVPVMAFLPLLLAILVQKSIPGMGFFRSMYYVPAIASVVVVALAWSFLLRDNGYINELLTGIGLIGSPIPFLTDRWWLLGSAMAVTIWKGLPYFMILYLTSLANVDKSLYEAAEVDGAGPVRRFWSITVPGVRIMMVLVAVLNTINCFKVFSEVHLLSNGTGGVGGRAQTITMYIREIGIADSTYGSLGQGSAASVALFLLTIGFVLTSQRLNRTEDR